VGIIPKNIEHYVKNTSETEEVEFLEIFRAPKFADSSLEPWLANVLGRMVAEYLFKDRPSTSKRSVEELRAAKEPVKGISKFETTSIKRYQ
jgi:oxalate decarboxylase/phosphoglucose isomerase-like protein (cupin superfamily)